MLWRDRVSPQVIANVGQLGGAQIGYRADRHFDTALPISLYGRLSRPLRAPIATEGAIGIAARPITGRAPVTIGIERRIALDSNARNAFAAIATTGLNPTPVIGSVVAEGYAQAGMVGLQQRDLFIDGRFSLTRPIAGREDISAGFSLSGGAQPGVERLDIGPVIQMRLPLAGGNSRLSIEWRHRIAGQAAPASGPAIIVASDF